MAYPNVQREIAKLQQAARKAKTRAEQARLQREIAKLLQPQNNKNRKKVA